MFLAIHPNFAPSSPSGAAPFGTALHNSAPYFGTAITGQLFSTLDNVTTYIVKDAVQVEGVATFTAAPETENITDLTQSDRIYTLALDIDNPEVGEFTFNPDTKAIAVYLQAGATGQIVYSAGISGQLLQSTQICNSYEPLLKKWNAFGNVVINDTWNSEPSASFSFQACTSDVSKIKSELDTGTIHTAFGNRWIVQSRPITYQKHGIITVTVNLIHWLSSYGNPSRSPLDKKIFLKKKTGRNSYKRIRSIADFAALSGVSYRGAPIKVRIPRSTSRTETTTLRSLLQSYAINVHGYIYYNSDGVEIKPWKSQKTVVISDEQLISTEIVENDSGHGSRLNGVKLHTEWRNLKINLDFAEESSNKEGITTDWAFENCKDLTDLYSAAEDKGWYYESPSVEVLRNPAICFDVGGAFIKKATQTVRLNGTPTFEVKYEAGYAFTSAQTYDTEVTSQGNLIIRLNTAQFAQTYWGLVRKTISDWVFNKSNYNYLEEIRITGTEKARLRQETDKLEAVNFKGKAIQNALTEGNIITPEPNFTNQAAAFEFTENLPVEDVTVYNLVKHRDYYDDVFKPEQCEEDFIEPMFALTTVRSRSDKFIRDNPANTETETLPPIEYGKYLKETTTVSITETKEDDAKYEVHSSTQTNEGERFKNSRAESTISYNDGKPGVHTRLNYEFDYEDLDSSAIARKERYKDEIYYLSSPGVVDSKIKTNEGSKGYRDVDDPNVVRAIATTELSILNTLNSLVINIIICHRNDLTKGDFALFRGRRWKILDIVDARSLDFERQTSDRLALKLGLYLEPKLELENRNSC